MDNISSKGQQTMLEELADSIVEVYNVGYCGIWFEHDGKGNWDEVNIELSELFDKPRATDRNRTFIVFFKI